MTPVAVLLVPAYEPPAELPRLVGEMLDAAGPSIRHCVVVNDGSSAACEETFRQLRAMDRVEVISHAVNIGKGAALKTGFNHILSKDPSVTAIVTADADGQHRPPDVAKVAAEHAAHPEQLILGSRSFHGEVPLRSRVGNRVSRLLFHLFTGLPLQDTQTGLRAWPRSHCLDALRLPFQGYEFEFEALLKASRSAIREVEIETIYAPGNPGSHFNPLRDSLRIYFVFLRYSASAVMAAIVDSTVFSLVLWRTGNVAAAQIAGRAAATMLAFVVLRNLVFRSTAEFWSPLLRFVMLVAASGTVSLALIDVLTGAGLPTIAAKLLAEGTLFAANFAVQRTLVFRREGPAV